MLIYALTVLVSSFLLFLVQPIIAKQIVPWFGGSAAVWTTCLTFFQLTLLAGYAYSDWVQRFRPKAQSILHALLLVISLAALPILAGTHWKPLGEEDPLFRILGLLTVTIGLPYFMLSTTGPLIQSWFAREQNDPVVAQRAYRLFALSNFGSLLGLLAYPFAIEAWVTTATQAWVWSGFYVVFVVLTVGVAFRCLKTRFSLSAVDPSAETALGSETAAAPRLFDYMLWFVLASLATMLLLAVSSHITQNIASIPFLWVLPLSLYLLTFVVAFEGRQGRGWYIRETMLLPAMVLAGFMAWGLVTDDGILAIDYAIPLYLLGLFVVCLFCHGELAQSKPQARFLTRFYFVVALGGAAGGLFVSMLAPRIFPFYWELPLALVAVGLIGCWVGYKNGFGPVRFVFVLGSLASVLVSVHFGRAYYTDASFDSVYASRNFYGTLRIKERRYSGADEPVRRLVHGVILHGLQDMNPDRRRSATTYYGPSSGVGLAILEKAKKSPSIRVGVIGLGVGTLAVYGRSGDYYRMYEINPEVISVAQNEFTYVKESAANVSFALGDARLVLEREKSNQFDVLVIDAFSSDSIPIHLMTREALAVYASHLKPDGVIAFHVTNRYLNLAPVVQAIALESGYDLALVSDEPTGDTHGLMALSDWVLVTKDRTFLAARSIVAHQLQIERIQNLKPWSDDFNNLFQVLK